MYGPKALVSSVIDSPEILHICNDNSENSSSGLAGTSVPSHRIWGSGGRNDHELLRGQSFTLFMDGIILVCDAYSLSNRAQDNREDTIHNSTPVSSSSFNGNIRARVPLDGRILS